MSRRQSSNRLQRRTVWAFRSAQEIELVVTVILRAAVTGGISGEGIVDRPRLFRSTHVGRGRPNVRRGDDPIRAVGEVVFVDDNELVRLRCLPRDTDVVGLYFVVGDAGKRTYDVASVAGCLPRLAEEEADAGNTALLRPQGGQICNGGTVDPRSITERRGLNREDLIGKGWMRQSGVFGRI